MARLFWPYRGRGPMQKRGWPDPNGQVYAGPLTLRLGRVVTARFARLHSAAQTKCQRCVEHVCQRCVETAHGPALPRSYFNITSARKKRVPLPGGEKATRNLPPPRFSGTTFCV